jgi:hypothetical protein
MTTRVDALPTMITSNKCQATVSSSIATHSFNDDVFRANTGLPVAEMTCGLSAGSTGTYSLDGS